MSYIQNFEFDFEVGDSFDLTPLEGSYVIGMILARGGECVVDGNTIIVTSMPGKTAPAPAPEPVAVEPTPEPAPDEGPIVPVIEHVTPDELEKISFVEKVLDTVQAELEPPLEEKAPPEVKAAPIKRARTPKAEEKESME